MLELNSVDNARQNRAQRRAQLVTIHLAGSRLRSRSRASWPALHSFCRPCTRRHDEGDGLGARLRVGRTRRGRRGGGGSVRLSPGALLPLLFKRCLLRPPKRSEGGSAAVRFPRPPLTRTPRARSRTATCCSSRTSTTRPPSRRSGRCPAAPTSLVRAAALLAGCRLVCACARV